MICRRPFVNAAKLLPIPNVNVLLACRRVDGIEQHGLGGEPMNKTQKKVYDRRAVELLKICDKNFFWGFNDALRCKSASALKAIAKDLGIKVSDIHGSADDVKESLVIQIGALIRELGGYRYVEGQLEIFADGTGLLGQVQLAAIQMVLGEGTVTFIQYDDDDVFLPELVIRDFHLKAGDTVMGMRRSLYVGEQWERWWPDEVTHVPLVHEKAKKSASQSKAQTSASETEASLPQQIGSNEEANTRQKGPCTECVHFRNGHSVVRPAFDAVLGSLKSQLQMAYTQKLHEERQSSDLAFVELESNIQQNRIDYTRRPTVPQIEYCGLDEFQGRFYLCQVKNLDERCDDFSRRGSDWNTRSCGTCILHRQPEASFVQTIENITGSRPKGQPVRDQIRQSLQYQAEIEFDACIDGTGILPVFPGLLPICLSYSSLSESRFVVGPVANAGEACDRWWFGKNAIDVENVNADLMTLLMRAQDAVKEYTSPSVMNDNITASTTMRQGAAGNAQADVIEHCLKALKVNPGFVDSICRQFTLDVWFSERKKGDWREEASYSRASPTQSPQATNVTPGIQTAQGFPVNVNTTYRHPRVEDLHFVIYQYPPYFTAQVNYIHEGKQDLFDLSQFQPRTWIQLIGKRGPIPIALAITGPPSNQFSGMWL
jgi:hypothetical protein